MAAMSDKKVEVLITTVNCKNTEALLQQMHIQSAACIGNQCEVNRIDTIQASGGSYIVYNFNERGVGLNRNNLLMRTKAEYCLFGDDDLVYVDGYENIVKDAFQTYPDADVILFNLEEETSSRYKSHLKSITLTSCVLALPVWLLKEQAYRPEAFYSIFVLGVVVPMRMAKIRYF